MKKNEKERQMISMLLCFLMQNFYDPRRTFVFACKSFVNAWKLYVCLRKICEGPRNFAFTCNTFAPRPPKKYCVCSHNICFFQRKFFQFACKIFAFPPKTSEVFACKSLVFLQETCEWMQSFEGNAKLLQTNKKFLGRAQNFCECTQSFLKVCSTVVNKRKD